jgi:hypothetical protein
MNKKGYSMTRNGMLKVLNPVLGLLVLNQGMTAIFRGVLPEKVFEVLHGVGGPLLLIFAITHLILNWNWIKATYLKRKITE